MHEGKFKHGSEGSAQEKPMDKLIQLAERISAGSITAATLKPLLEAMIERDRKKQKKDFNEKEFFMSVDEVEGAEEHFRRQGQGITPDDFILAMHHLIKNEDGLGIWGQLIEPKLRHNTRQAEYDKKFITIVENLKK